MNFSNLYLFLKEETGYEINDTSPNLRIEKDLGIYGDEAEDFIIKFSKEFNIDISNFAFNNYFNLETDKISLFIFNFFKKTVRKDLTISDLKKAIEIGKLE
jgi:hypothetical protein